MASLHLYVQRLKALIEDMPKEGNRTLLIAFQSVAEGIEMELQQVKELERQQAMVTAEVTGLRQQRGATIAELRAELRAKDTTIAQLRQQLQEQAAAAKAPPAQPAVAAPINDGKGAGSEGGPAAGGMEMGSKPAPKAVEPAMVGVWGRVLPVAAATIAAIGDLGKVPPVMSHTHSREQQPIFDDIKRGDLEAVQQRVLGDATVLEERGTYRQTPLIFAIFDNKPTIALWLLEHRGQHDANAADNEGSTALHYASLFGLLDVVEALVVAGAKPAALDGCGWTPLMTASRNGHIDTVAFLLQLPAVKASVDQLARFQATALSIACIHGHQPIVQLLLDAGADPHVPAGPYSPLNQALRRNHHNVAALIRHAIAERERARVSFEGRVDQGRAAMAVSSSAASSVSSTRKGVEKDGRLGKRQRPGGNDEQNEGLEEEVAMGGCEDDGSDSEDAEVEMVDVHPGPPARKVQRGAAAGPLAGPTAPPLEALRVVLRRPLLCGVEKAALRWAMGRQEMLGGLGLGDYDDMWRLLDFAPARKVKGPYVKYPWIRWLAMDFAGAVKPTTVEEATAVVVGLSDILDALPFLHPARTKAEIRSRAGWMTAELELWRARAFIHKALATATAGPLLECYYKLLAGIVDVSVEALKEEVHEERAVEGLSETLAKAAFAKGAEEQAYIQRDKSGRFASPSSVKPALPLEESVEMAIYREAAKRGFKFKAPVLLEKLSLAFPGPIPDMETFKATMQLPEVQAMYRSAYEHCENNPKRGTILKLFEVAGVNPKVVKMQRKKKRLAAAAAAADQAQAAAVLATFGRLPTACPPCVAAKRKCLQTRGEYCEWSGMNTEAAASPAPTAATAAASSAQRSDEASAASAFAVSAAAPQLPRELRMLLHEQQLREGQKGDCLDRFNE